MRKTWSPARLASGTMLAAWSAMFWFLIFSGRSLLYVSSRTEWVVPTGAVILSAAAVGRLWSARTAARPEPVRKKEAWILGLMMLPIVSVLVLPPASLGTYAASRRSSFLRAGFSTSAADIASGPLTLIDLASSPATELSQKALQERAGDHVSFVGIVAIYPDTSADEFYLTRFVITCCVADATVAQVHVVDVTPGQFKNGDWIQVDGTFYPLGSEMIVDAQKVTAVAQPHNPYLTP